MISNYSANGAARQAANPPQAAPSERAELVARFVREHPPEVVIRAYALRLAKQCREVIQGCLREEEWRDCDEEFFRIIQAGLAEWWAARTQVAE